jgi:hypothetical protein
MTFESRPHEKFGDAVRDWNIRVKRVKEIQMMARHDIYREVLK